MERGKITRRSFLAQVVGAGVLVGGAALRPEPEVRQMIVDADPSDPARMPGTARAQARTGYSDSDQGATADPPNFGRRGRRGSNRTPTSGPRGISGGGRERFVPCPGHRRCPD